MAVIISAAERREQREQLKRGLLALLCARGALRINYANGEGARLAAELVASGLAYDEEDDDGCTRLVVTRAGTEAAKNSGGKIG